MAALLVNAFVACSSPRVAPDDEDGFHEGGEAGSGDGSGGSTNAGRGGAGGSSTAGGSSGASALGGSGGSSGAAAGGEGGFGEAGGGGAPTGGAGGTSGVFGGGSGGSAGSGASGGASGVGGSSGGAGLGGAGAGAGGGGGSGGATGPASVAWGDFQYSLVNGDVYAFTVSTGAPGSDRTLIIVTHAASDYAVSFDSVQVDSVMATKITSVSEEAMPTAPTAIFTATLPAGTESLVEVRLSVPVVRCAIAVYAAYGLATPDSAYATSSLVATGSDNFSVDAPAGGIIVGGLGMAGDQASASYWITMELRYDTVMVEGTPTLVSGAMLDDVPSTGPYEIGIQTVNAGYNFRAVAASFR